MDIKDILTTAGLLLSLTLGLVSIGVSLVNRRNTLREHLYKEQLGFYTKAMGRFSIFIILMEDAEQDRLLGQEENLKKNLQIAFDQLQLINFKIKQYSIICEDSVYSRLDQSYEIGLNLWVKFTTNEPNWKNTYKDFSVKLKLCLDQIREIMGIDRLSAENQKLAGATKSQKEKELLSMSMKKAIDLLAKQI